MKHNHSTLILVFLVAIFLSLTIVATITPPPVTTTTSTQSVNFKPHSTLSRPYPPDGTTTPNGFESILKATTILQSQPKQHYKEVPDPEQELVDRYFKQYAGHGLWRGSASLYKDGKVWSTANGFVDDAQTIPVTTSTKYRVGSITKTFIAVLTMRAIEDGYFSLTSPLSWWFPQSRYGILVADRITISMLLSHRAHLYNYTDDPEFNIYAPYHDANDVFEFIRKHQHEMPLPDSQDGSYSNSGFYLLGIILEMEYKKPLQEIIQEKLFVPFDMIDSTFITRDSDDHHPTTSDHQVSAFDPLAAFSWSPRSNRTYTNWGTTAGAGAIISTPEDLIKFYVCVFAKQKFISLGSIRKMQDWHLLPAAGILYGYGIFRVALPSEDQRGYHFGFGHNGVVDGFYSQISITSQYPDQDPLESPFVIYAQSSNSFNMDLSTTILAMNKYLHTGSVQIPDLLSLHNNQTRLPLFVGEWYADSHQLPAQTSIVDGHVNNWNETNGVFEDVQLKQLVLHIQGVSLPMNPSGQPDTFTYLAYGISMQFISQNPADTDQPFNTIIFNQNGVIISFVRKV